MTPREAVAAERAHLERLKALPRIPENCEYHGLVAHGLDGDDLWCVPCATERLDSMADAARDVVGRIRWEQDADLHIGANYKPGHSSDFPF